MYLSNTKLILFTLIKTMFYTLLRSFHAVANHGGFTAAARALNVGQPTITTQVRQLEKQYGVELLVRAGRKVELTDAGRDLYEVTRRLIAAEQEGRDLLQAHGGRAAGRLRLAAVGPFHATEMVSAFKAKNPQVEVIMIFGNSQRTLQRLTDLEADVAVLAHVDDDPRVHMVPYSQHRVVAFVNKDHPWYGRQSIRLSDLPGQRILLREPGSTTRLAFETAIRAAGVEIDPVMEIGSREAIWKGVECGLGVGIVADFEYVPHADLCPLTIEDAEVKTRYFIAYLKSRQHAPLIRSFQSVALELATRLAGRNGQAKRGAAASRIG